MLLDALQIRVPKETCTSRKKPVHQAGLPERTLGYGIHQLLWFPIANLFFASKPRYLVLFFPEKSISVSVSSVQKGRTRLLLILACRAQEIQRHRQGCRTRSDINGALSSQAKHSHASENSCQTPPDLFPKTSLPKKKKRQIQRSVAQ